MDLRDALSVSSHLAVCNLAHYARLIDTILKHSETFLEEAHIISNLQ